MTNVIPQTPALNQGLWRDLEGRIAGGGGIAEKCKEVWVTVGPVFDKEVQTLKAGVEIPDACYMIVVDVDEANHEIRLLAIEVPNLADHRALGKDPAKYLTSGDRIEQETGLDFLGDLEDALEERLEAQRAAVLWN